MGQREQKGKWIPAAGLRLREPRVQKGITWTSSSLQKEKLDWRVPLRLETTVYFCWSSDGERRKPALLASSTSTWSSGSGPSPPGISPGNSFLYFADIQMFPFPMGLSFLLWFSTCFLVSPAYQELMQQRAFSVEQLTILGSVNTAVVDVDILCPGDQR